MSTVEFRVYERDNPTALIASLEHAYDKTWFDDLVDVGSGGFTIPHDAAEVAANPDLLDRGNIVRVRIDGTDRMGFLVPDIERPKGDTFDPIGVQGPGVKASLASAVVYPECWPLGDDLVPDVRLFGWMSGDYVEDPAEWDTPLSFGEMGDRPFSDDRPSKWSDRAAEFISPDAVGGTNERDDFYRAELVVPEEMHVRFEATADDELTFYLCGVPLIETFGAFQWANTFHKTVRLPPGAYPVGCEVHNLQRPTAATNIAWLLFSALRAGASGDPQAQREVQHVYNDAGLNEVQEVHNDSTTGTFTLTFSGETTGAIAHDATAQQVEDALQALANIEDVEVTGTGDAADPWIIEWFDPGNRDVSTLVADDTGMDGTTTVTTTQQGGGGGTFTLSFAGDATAAIAFDASAVTVENELNALDSVVAAGGVTVDGDGTAAAPWVVSWNAYGNQPVLQPDDTNLVDGATTVSSVTDGSSPDVLLRSNTTDWTVNSDPPSRPGMTPGHIGVVLLAEAQARGALEHVTPGFTADLDSAGDAWPDELEIGFQIGNDNALTVCQRLGDYGVDFDVSPTLVWDLYAGRGTDKSASVELLESDVGSRTGADALKSSYHQGIVNVALVRTDRGWVEYPTSGAPSTDRHEGFLAYGLEPAHTSPSVAVDNVLTAYRTARQVVTARHHDGNGPVPYAAYDLGDSITGPGLVKPTDQAWSQLALRVYGLGGDETNTGEIDWTVKLVDE